MPEHRQRAADADRGQRDDGHDGERRVQVEGHRDGHPAQRGRQGQVPAALARPVGVPAPQHHRDRAGEERDRDDRPGLEDRVAGVEALREAGDHGRQEERDRVQAVDDAEVDEAQTDHPQVGHRPPRGGLPRAGRLALGGDGAGQPAAFLGGEPAGVLGAVGQVGPARDAEQHGGQALHQEHHPPALQAEQPVGVLDDRARQRRSQGRGQRDGHEEGPDQLHPPGPRQPPGEVEEDPGEEAGLGDAEQHPQRVQPARRVDEGHGAGDDAPADHDPGDPAAGAEAVQRQVARHLEEQVADEEQPRGQPEHRLGQPEVLAHRELGEADVGAVEVVDEVEEPQEGHQPPRDLAQRAPPDRVGLGVGHGSSRRRPCGCPPSR